VTSSDLPARLRDVLADAGFTYDGVAEVLGHQAQEALGRNETVPGLRRTAGGSPVATLVRLFLLQAPVPIEDAQRALPGLLDELSAEGILEHTAGEVGALLDIRPYAAGDRDLWVVSDLTPGLDGSPNRVGTDHVLGISPASTSLAQLTIRDPVDRSLDLGTGCGVQALHMAEHSGTVVATDVNARALRITRLNAALNGVDNVVVRDGSLFGPVGGERFDLIATNPPFVISPATDRRLVYRDSGMPGDQVVEHIVRAAPGHLTEGGWCQVLTNWVIARDLSWEERLAGWLTDECDALVVQREVLDPAAYVELWLKDAGLHGSHDYLDRYDAWLSWFDDQGVEAVGFGWVNLHRRRASDQRRGRHAFLDWPHAVEQPVAPAIAAWGAAVDHKVTPEDLLVRREDVHQETLGVPGAEDPTTVVLRQQRGLMRARRTDTIEAALVGACDGDLTIGQILDALAQLLDRDAAELRSTYLPVVRELVEEGFLTA
jgi:hypothetical protein